MAPVEPNGILEPPRKPSPGKLRIAIVTPDILGPVRNGGVGTAYWEIATLLAREGHGVTIIFAPTTDTQVNDLERWQRHYLNHGVALLPGKPPAVRLECQLPMQRSYAIYEQLKQYAFDLIHFPDMHGMGYYSLLAKKMGLDFQSTTLAVQAHGPNSWHRQFNEQDLSTQDEIIMDYMERKSLELADQVIVSHPSILEWFKDRDWTINGEVSVLPLPCESTSLVPKEPGPKNQKPNEVVFFGRIETRKGVRVFCDALDLLARQETRPRKITFLGKPGTVSAVDAIQYIRERSRQWPFTVSFLTDFGRDAALDYLQEGRKITILPYRAETFGYTFEECLRRKIPFIATALPVFTERVEEEFHGECFFDGSAEDLAAKIQTAMAKDLRPARVVDQKPSAIEKWIGWHEKLSKKSGVEKSSQDQNPLVSVCISHRNRPEYLSQAIQSILSQTYRNFEIIVSDDASDSPAAKSYLETVDREFSSKGWKVLRQTKQSGPGAIRNRAVAEAKGEYVLLMDDDNVAKPDEIETFVRSAQSSGSDILTCFFDRILDKSISQTPTVISRWLCLGDDLSSGFYSNVFGDMNALIRRRTFMDLGGLNEATNVGCEDWEFFARAVASGLKLSVVPKALFFYRDHESSYTRRVDLFRSRLLPRTVYSMPLPKGSLTALMSYAASQVKFDHAPTMPSSALREPNRIYGDIDGTDIYQLDEYYQKVLFDLDHASDHERLSPLRQLTITYSDGRAQLDSEGSDPGIEILGIDLNGSDRILVDVEIESPKETCFQFFFRSTNAPEYDERFSVRHPLATGLNRFRFMIEEKGLQAPFRIDPAESDGTFLLRRLVIRCET